MTVCKARVSVFWLTLLAFVISLMASFLPTWTSSRHYKVVDEGSVKYDVGLWGICVNVDAKALSFFIGYSEITSKKCYYYYDNSKIAVAREEEGEESVCRAYTAHTLPLELHYISPEFLQYTCGTYGIVTNVIISIFMFGSFVMLLLMVFGRWCCRKNKCVIRTARVIGYVGVLLSILLLIYWVIIQERSLNEDGEASFGAAFILQIFATIALLLASLLIEEQIKQAIDEEDDEQFARYCAESRISTALLMRNLSRV